MLKFDGPDLEQLLERVQSELGPQVTIVEANRTRKGGIGGFFAREWFEVVVDQHPAPVDDPLLALASSVDDVREVAQAPELGEPTAAEGARLGETVLISASQEVSAFELVLAGAQRASAVGAMDQVAEPPMPRLMGPVPAPAARRLRDLPLPELLGHLDAMIPAPLLPVDSAPVVAVVGDPNQVRQVAATIAVRLGLSDADVVVAGPHPDGVSPWLALSDPKTARARASRWREVDHPTVVAVELLPGADGHAWAASMLQALGADQVRLVAKAWQLTEQLGTKALALGGVDGLELVEMDAAAEPELFLELDLAVLGIDGRPATAELWAALMYERRTDERHQ